jgi:transposase
LAGAGVEQGLEGLAEKVCRALREGKTIKEAAAELGVEYWRAYSVAVKMCGWKPRRRRGRLSEEEKEAICSMLARGAKVSEVAKALGVGEGTVVRVKEEYCGLAKKRSWRRTREEEKREICRMLSECWGTRGCQKTVAARTGKSEATISRIAKWCISQGLLPEKS